MTPPARDPRLDALRGWLQITIFVSHTVGSAVALWAIHPAWGLSDSSEQFVFLSGLALGSVFLWKQARQGFGGACRDLARRMARLWRMHLLVFLGFGLMVALAATQFAHVAPWPFAMAEPWLALLGGALTLYQPPPFMGVLPVFLWSMALLPVFCWLAGRFGAQALWMPAILYALGQALPPDIPALFGTTLAFSPAPWTALFLLGAWFGREILHGRRAVPHHPLLLAAAAAMLAAGLAMRLLDWMPQVWTGKEQLAPLRLAHALALAYLVAVLVPRDAAWARSAPGRALGTIGRHSLQVFSLGLFLSFLASLVLHEAPAAQWWSEPLLLAAGVAILWALARRLEPRPAPAPAPARG